MSLHYIHKRLICFIIVTVNCKTFIQSAKKISTFSAVPILTQERTWNGSYNQGPSDEHKS